MYQPPSYQTGPYGSPRAPKPTPTFEQWFRKRSSRTRKIFFWVASVTGLIVYSCVGISVFASATQQSISTVQQTRPHKPTHVALVMTRVPIPTPLSKPKPTLTRVPTSTPTPQSIHYPPKTVTDLRGLAAKGVVSAIHEFHSESVGLTGVCPQPKREVTVGPNVTGQQLAEDLLAYFYAQQIDSPCGSIVFAYHDQAEADDVYTAGRIKFDVTDASGVANLDPNASNLKHTLTLDIGGDLTNQEYVVTY